MRSLPGGLTHAELHGPNRPLDQVLYDELGIHMKNGGFSQTIVSFSGDTLLLPRAEYVTEEGRSLADVLHRAITAVAKLGVEFSILSTAPAPTKSFNLKPARGLRAWPDRR